MSYLRIHQLNGAQEKTRTSTTLRSQAPEACASTNSATWASKHLKTIVLHRGPVIIDLQVFCQP